MRKSKYSERLRLCAANDNNSSKLEVQADFPANFPVTEIELEIVETYLSAIIMELVPEPKASPANDNKLNGAREE